MTKPDTERICEAAHFLNQNGFGDVVPWIQAQLARVNAESKPRRERQVKVYIGPRKLATYIPLSTLKKAQDAQREANG